MRKVRRILLGGWTVALLVFLPLAGVMLRGDPASRYLEFPPRTRYIEPVAFSRPAFLLVAVMALLLFLPLLVWFIRAVRRRPRRPPAGRFPVWGWAGLAFGLAGWGMAWTRFSWAASFQPYTYSPHWFGFILAVNGLVYRIRGSCRLTANPGRYALLFPASAAYWWYFEYLNRFVQNWHYEGIADLTAQGYFWMATLAFSTVLPAVLGTYDLLFAWLGRGESGPVPARSLSSRTAWPLLVTGTLGLAFLGLRPDGLFPMLWIAPILILSFFRILSGRLPLEPEPGEALMGKIARLAVAALICGFFWEMWNFYSQARWIYTVPYVGRFHVFEMPILGYAGYLPFGIECALLGDLLPGGRPGFEEKT
jgi:hypothetical protein